MSMDLVAERPEWVDHGRIPTLDGFRAVAITMVVVSHLAPTTNSPIPARYWHITSLGWLGVPLFFVISGFVITTLLLRERDRTGRVSYAAFMSRRVLRIVPAYVVLLITLALAQQVGWVYIRAWDWFLAATYTTSMWGPSSWEIGHTWSLSVEEHFYLAWPLLMITFRSPWRIVLGCALISPFVRLVAFYTFHGSTSELDFLTVTRVDGIAWGCCLAFATRCSGWGCISAFISRWWVAGVLAVALITVVGLSYFLQSRSPTYRLIGYHSVNSACLCGFVGLAVANHQSWVGKALSSRLAAAAGCLSYSVYLWQQPFLKEGSTALLCQWPVNILAVMTLATTSYLLVELPFLRLKDHYSRANRADSCVSPT